LLGLLVFVRLILDQIDQVVFDATAHERDPGGDGFAILALSYAASSAARIRGGASSE